VDAHQEHHGRRGVRLTLHSSQSADQLEVHEAHEGLEAFSVFLKIFPSSSKIAFATFVVFEFFVRVCAVGSDSAVQVIA
jgi:hypothetical protein